MNEQIVISDFIRILEKIDKFRKRLEQTVPVSICEGVYRTLNRVDVLKKNIDKLLEQKSIIDREYEIIKKRIWFIKRTLSLIVVPAVASTAIIAIYLAFLTIIVTNPAFVMENNVSQTTLPSIINHIYRSLRENPLNYLITLSVGGVSIFILVVIAGFAYGKIYRRVNIKEVISEEKNIAEKLSSLRVRIEALQRRYEKDTPQLLKLHETHSCLCYNELNKLYSTIEIIKNKLIYMKNSEDKKSVLISIRDFVIELKDKKVFCASPVTDEFRIEIYVDPDILKALEELINEEKIDWGKYVESSVKLRFSNSPLIYELPLINELKKLFLNLPLHLILIELHNPLTSNFETRNTLVNQFLQEIHPRSKLK